MKRWCASLPVLVAAVLFWGCGDGGGGDDEFAFSSEDNEHYLDVWCDLELGMARDEVIEIMGEPSEEFDAESGAQPQSQWGDYFTVFYSSDGTAEQLYINELSISEEDAAELSCPLVRL